MSSKIKIDKALHIEQANCSAPRGHAIQLPRDCWQRTVRWAGSYIDDVKIDLKSVASNLGFPDQSSFGRAFRR